MHSYTVPNMVHVNYLHKMQVKLYILCKLFTQKYYLNLVIGSCWKYYFKLDVSVEGTKPPVEITTAYAGTLYQHPY